MTGTETQTRTPTPSYSPTKTATGTVSPTPTATTTTVEAFHFTLVVYNSAGEQVTTLSANTPSLTNPDSSFTLSLPTFDPSIHQAETITAGSFTAVWSGANSGSQMIQNGSYYVTLTTTDPYGKVTTMTKSVTLLSTAVNYTLDIYNSAGELVTVLTKGVYGGGVSAPSKVVPDKLSLIEGESGSQGTVSFNLGNGLTPIAWNGTNSQGQEVQGGTYLAELSVSEAGGAKQQYSASITVISTNSALLEGALMGPNPLNMGLGEETEVLKTMAPVGTELEGRLYDLAGELVMWASNGGGGDALKLELGNRRVSAGIYILVVRAKASDGATQTKSFKLVIMR